MITWVRSGEISQGQMLPATQWALKVAAYVNDTFDLNIIVQSNVGGPLNQLHWVGNYESLAHYEDVSQKIFEDGGYLQLINEASEQQLFNSNSLTDRFFRTIG